MLNNKKVNNNNNRNSSKVLFSISLAVCLPTYRDFDNQYIIFCIIIPFFLPYEQACIIQT